MRSLLLIIGAVLVESAGMAQVVPVPMEVQVPLILKIVSFDRRMYVHTTGEITIGIVYQSAIPYSRAAYEEFTSSFGALNAPSIGGIPVRYVPIDLSATDNPNALPDFADITVLYLAPMHSPGIRAFVTHAHLLNILTITGTPAFADLGAGVILKARNGRPVIQINIAACRLASVQFDAQLLRIAEVTHDH